MGFQPGGEQEFIELSNQAWTHLLMQIVKVFILFSEHEIAGLISRSYCCLVPSAISPRPLKTLLVRHWRAMCILSTRGFYWHGSTTTTLHRGASCSGTQEVAICVCMCEHY